MMADTRVYKVLFSVAEGINACGAVEYEGAIWLVPRWLPVPDEGYSKPERMIRLDQFRYERIDPPSTGPDPLGGVDFAVHDPLPKELFDGELTPTLKARYDVLDKPDVRFQMGGVRH
jgi:hypothetical protein